MIDTTSAFARLWSLGYTRIVPVIPPDAQISENSTLYKRVNTRQDARGKLPGVKGRNGLWHSWDWTQHQTDASDFPRWHAMGAGVGIITGEGLLAIDADTMDEALAKTIRDTVKEHLGQTPIRVGRYPKALYLIRVTDPYAYRRIDFGASDAHGNHERVEILSDRKFFVAEGIHPKTGKPYTWPRPLAPYDDLPLFRPDQIDVLMEALRQSLPAASKVQIEGGGETPVNQDALRGDPGTIRKAVRATPNTSAHFPTRESYRDFGYAIKAALPDNEAEAFDIFADWCARWDEGDNDPGVVEADWRRMKPPFRRGAGWVYEIAERLSGGQFTQAEIHFSPIPDRGEPSPFDVQAINDAEDARMALDFAPWGERDLAAIPYPEFVYSDFYARGYTSVTLAPPKVGKSMLGLAEALDMASGKGILTGKPRAPLKVVYYNAEDDQAVVDSRVAALLVEYGIAQHEIADTLFPVSGVLREDFFMVSGAEPVINEALFAGLEAFVKRVGADVLVFDPLQDLSRSPETNDVFRLLGQRLRRMASSCNVALGLIHHTRKITPGATATIDDGRGGSALRGTARFNRLLIGMSEEEAAKAGVDNHRRFLRVADMESNLAPPSADVNRWFEKVSVTIPNGRAVGAVRAWQWPDACDGVELNDAARVQREIRQMEEAPRADTRSPQWVGVTVGRLLGIGVDTKAGKERVRGIVQEWLKTGILRVQEVHDARAGRRVSVVLAGDMSAFQGGAGSVFD